MKIAFLGAFDPEYPRTRVLHEGLVACGVEVRLLAASPREAPLARETSIARAWARGFSGVDAFLVPSFCHRDVPLAFLLARISDAALLFDPLVSRWDTQVRDLRRLPERSLAAVRMRYSDRISMTLPDIVLCDTWAHGEYFAQSFHVPRRKLARVPVGADQAAFSLGSARASRIRRSETLEVVYVGGFLPLHGISVIVEAAAALEARHGSRFARFTMVGDGMEAHRFDRDVAALGLRSVRRKPRAPYAEALATLAEADVALGIFGTTEKAARVVPHKVYQALALGVPTVTRRSGALSELFRDGEALLTVPPGDGRALAQAVEELAQDPERRERIGIAGRSAALREAEPARIGAALVGAIERACASYAPNRPR